MVIKWNDEVERLIKDVEIHVVNATDLLLRGKIFNLDCGEVYQRSSALALFHIIYSLEDDLVNFAKNNRGESFDLIQIVALSKHLSIIEDSIENHFDDICYIDIDGEKVLFEIHLAIELLKNFTLKLIRLDNLEKAV